MSILAFFLATNVTQMSLTMCGVKSQDYVQIVQTSIGVMKMSKHKVIVEEVATAILEIEAEDEFEAEDIAMEMWSNGGLDVVMMRDVSVTVEQ